MMRRNLRAVLAEWLDRQEVSSSAITLASAVIVGLGAGFGAVAFRWLLGAVRWVGYQPLAGVVPAWLLILAVPAIGGLIVGALVYWFAPEAKGHGVPEVMEAVALRGGRIRPRVSLVKALASGFCIGTGGSAGREGPIVQIGSAIGSTVGQAFKFSDDRVRSLVACGAAGGIAATFHAPIAGAIFAIEVILGRFHTLYFGAVVISAVVADVVAQAFTDETRAFIIPEYTLNSPWELPLYVLLGIVAALLSVVYSRGLYLVEDLWERLRGAEWVRPALGGLVLGAIGVVTLQDAGLPRIFGVGYGSVSDALLGRFTLQAAILLLGLKMLATWITLGSGGSGGIFAPSLFMGSMMGAAFGGLVNTIWPGITAPAGAYALVGMAAFFSGAAHAPVTAILILFEMTGDYRIILPLMLATVISTALSSLVSRDSIYTLKLSRRGVHLEHGRDVDVMQRITVGEMMTPDVSTISDSASLDVLADELARSSTQAVVLLGGAGEMSGIVSVTDLDREVEPTSGVKASASDIATREVVVVYPDDTMGTALRRLGTRDVSGLPVLSRESGRPVGYISRDHIVRAYNQAVSQRHQVLHHAEELGLGSAATLSLLNLPVAEGAPAVGSHVRDLVLPDDCLIVSVRRGTEQRVVRGSTVLSAGDVVTVVAPQLSLPRVRDQLTGQLA